MAVAVSARRKGHGLPDADFLELKRQLKNRGLLEPDRRAHAWRIVETSAYLACAIWLLFTLESLVLQMLNAVFFGFAFVRCGVVNHDASHCRIFRDNRWNLAVRYFFGNFCIGLSTGWWRWEHNRHHATPNVLNVDPDIAVPHLAFDERQYAEKGRWGRFLARYQAFLFLPLLSLQCLYLRWGAIEWLLTRPSRQRRLESVLVAAHFVAYFLLVFGALPPGQALVFIAVHQASFGFCAGTIFAPGHKGLVLENPDHPLDYLRFQVKTTRNIRAHAGTDFWYAGLHYQVEHHLFPAMSTSRFAEAREIITRFCRERGISILETGSIQTYADILRYLHGVTRAGDAGNG